MTESIQVRALQCKTRGHRMASEFLQQPGVGYGNGMQHIPDMKPGNRAR